MIDINPVNVITVGLIAVAAVFVSKFALTYFKVGQLPSTGA